MESSCLLLWQRLRTTRMRISASSISFQTRHTSHLRAHSVSLTWSSSATCPAREPMPISSAASTIKIICRSASIECSPKWKWMAALKMKKKRRRATTLRERRMREQCRQSHSLWPRKKCLPMHEISLSQSRRESTSWMIQTILTWPLAWSKFYFHLLCRPLLTCTAMPLVTQQKARSSTLHR